MITLDTPNRAAVHPSEAQTSYAAATSDLIRTELRYSTPFVRLFKLGTLDNLPHTEIHQRYFRTKDLPGLFTWLDSRLPGKTGALEAFQSVVSNARIIRTVSSPRLESFAVSLQCPRPGISRLELTYPLDRADYQFLIGKAKGGYLMCERASANLRFRAPGHGQVELTPQIDLIRAAGKDFSADIPDYKLFPPLSLAVIGVEITPRLRDMLGADNAVDLIDRGRGTAPWFRPAEPILAGRFEEILGSRQIARVGLERTERELLKARRSRANA